jgi:hypothetical protein
MSNGRKKVRGTFAASILLAASLAAAPAAAQTGSGTGESDDPYTCNFKEDYYSCCPRYDPCTQIFIGDAPVRPEEPLKPSDSPEE